MPQHPTMTLIGQRIRSVREKRGLTQPALAEKVGSTQKTVSGWETGRSQIRLLDIVRVCNALDVSSDYLLCRVDRESDLRVRQGPIQFADPEAIATVRKARTVRDVEDLFQIGVQWGVQVSPDWELITAERWDELERDLASRLRMLPGHTMAWIRSLIERRQREPRERND